MQVKFDIAVYGCNCFYVAVLPFIFFVHSWFYALKLNALMLIIDVCW